MTVIFMSKNTEIHTLNLAGADELDIVKTFECGQCFRWNADENGVYTGVDGERQGVPALRRAR